MQHCSPEDLSLLALGEDVDVDTAHLRTCEECSSELESLRSVVTAARSGRAEEVAPPPAVWAGIAAATGVRVADRPAPAVPSQHQETEGRRARPPAETVDVPATPFTPGRHSTPGTPGPPSRRWPTWALAAASVAGLLLGGGVVAAVVDRPGPEPTTVATADLEPLVETANRGTADLVDRDGELVLRLTTGTLPEDADGFHEVWLLDEQAQRMVPLGILVGEQGDFPVPAGLDVADFPVVDVSVEPFDGDPTHSGNSLVRGTLQG